jgi:SAM-dependent methyltransferase
LGHPATIQNLRCPVCDGEARPLCVPHVKQSILSDGRVILHELRKSSCVECGAAFHASGLSPKTVHAIYDSGYSLAQVAQKSDIERARAYARWIQTVCPIPRSVLEIGCGSGALLRELSKTWPETVSFGVDPALSCADRSDPRVRLERGFAEDIPTDLSNFDLIIAVNVIEHALNPNNFLTSLRSRLASNGTIIIVCPAAYPPNSEMLFFDHLYSFTSYALSLAVVGTTLAARNHLRAPATIGDFQMVTFEIDTANQPMDPNHFRHSFAELWSKRQDYLNSWHHLDRNLLDRARSAARLIAFGGGQTAALLRAYAPETWARVELMLLDDVEEAWQLAIPAASYRDNVTNLKDAMILVATSPLVQGVIAERLRSDGLRPIRWDDLITN